ncbi:MAG TPA: hypothetical protein VGX48_25965 [Pyrinomonadaceae bacterium]|jgi:hypothetical protein|nr:hypothetical protein [Pyrinomonadaceae bacterium]
MFCPKCGAAQTGELNFCKSCGANLQALRRIEEAGDKFDWSRTWVADMFLSEGERKRRNEELERRRGITPEVKRYNEIKAGVIVACVGLGLAIFLNVFMEGVILSGVGPSDAAIISRIWIAGIIPFFVGLALIFNGLVVSRKQAEVIKHQQADAPPLQGGAAEGHALRSADTNEFLPPDFSVTDATTKHLRSTAPKP